jgi:hypothetical protein
MFAVANIRTIDNRPRLSPGVEQDRDRISQHLEYTTIESR